MSDFLQLTRRVLCYNALADADVKAECTLYGTSEYYFFTPHSIVTRAKMKTKYCILPIRSERTREKEGLDITVNDEWE